MSGPGSRTVQPSDAPAPHAHRIAWFRCESPACDALHVELRDYDGQAFARCTISPETLAEMMRDAAAWKGGT